MIFGNFFERGNLHVFWDEKEAYLFACCFSVCLNEPSFVNYGWHCSFWRSIWFVVALNFKISLVNDSGLFGDFPSICDTVNEDVESYDDDAESVQSTVRTPLILYILYQRISNKQPLM